MTKRKLDEADVPTELTGSVFMEDGSPKASAQAAQTEDFTSLGLEARLLQAIAKENYLKPTEIQVKAIRAILERKDLLARSKTGSGKTAAYILPILQSVLQRKHVLEARKTTAALILVPTRELAQQVSKAISTFTAFCSKDVRAVNLTQQVPQAVQRTLLADSPDIVVATPARAAQNIQNSALLADNLTCLVIDEADLVLSYGYEDDLQTISKAMPKDLQTILLSATLTPEVNTLNELFCQDPTIIDIQEKPQEDEGVSQYIVRCAEDDKFLLAYVIFKLQLIKGKCIIFVGDIDRCYRLKLFLEQFGVKSCVLNSELPVNSRIHVVEAFNKNVYDIIIAADEHEVLDVRPKKSTAANDAGVVVDDEPDDQNTLPGTNGQKVEQSKSSSEKQNPNDQRQSHRSKKSKEYGVSRGIDFQNVSCVLNFDLPTTSKSYTHRIGRTARAGKTGMALSFVIPTENYRQHPSTTFPSAEHDEEVLAKITRHQHNKGKEVKPYHFDMKQVDAFRYRMNDALRAVTRMAIREARTRELRQELLNSEKLKRHFEENPEDLHHLRHDGELRAARTQHHLRHVPDYLMPTNGKKGIAGDDVGFVALRKTTDNRIRKARMQNRAKGKRGRANVKRSDPLKTFNAKGRR